MRSVEELCQFYISFLQSVAIVHQTAHWITKGKNFYGNHLLFEKLYETTTKNLDTMSEKLVGVFNPECLDLKIRAQIIKHTLDKYAGKEPIQGSLEIENEFQAITKTFYEALKNEEKLTLGLDDAILSTANSQEENIYHLKQANDGQNLSISPVVARIDQYRKLIQAHHQY